MPGADGGEGLVFLDACCLINLFATGRAEEILRALPYDFAVARYVAEEEVLEIEPAGPSGENPAPSRGSRERLSAPIRSLITTGLLQQWEVSSPSEYQELIAFATQVDDGEAHTLALALSRGARVATDDKKALRIFREAWEERFRPEDFADPCLRTLELLFEWADSIGLQGKELAEVVRFIARRASFFPPKSDSYFDRWMELLRRFEG